MIALSFVFRVVAAFIVTGFAYVLLNNSYAYGAGEQTTNNFVIFLLVQAAIFAYVLRAKYKIWRKGNTGAQYALYIVLFGMINLIIPTNALWDVYKNPDLFETVQGLQWFKMFICVASVLFSSSILVVIEEKNRSFVEDLITFHWIDAAKEATKSSQRMLWALYAFTGVASTALSIASMYWTYTAWGWPAVIVELAIMTIIGLYLIFVVVKWLVNKGGDALQAGKEAVTGKSEPESTAPDSSK